MKSRGYRVGGLMAKHARCSTIASIYHPTYRRPVKGEAGPTTPIILYSPRDRHKDSNIFFKKKNKTKDFQ